jgi:hypothetical protein
MEIIIALIYTVFPSLVEFSIDGYRTLKLKRNDRHGVTGAIRCFLIFCVGFNPFTQFWWQGALLASAFHILVFNYSFALLILDREAIYLGNNILDRADKWLASKITALGVLTIKMILFASAVKFYINPNIYNP